MTTAEAHLLLKNSDFQTLFKSQKDKLDITKLFEQIQEEIKTNLLTQFGLSQFYDNYQKGGTVTTLHNARKEVFANEEDQRRYQNPYDRKNYEGRKKTETDPNTGKRMVTFDNTLKTQRKNKFQSTESLKDAYTGKKLEKDGRTHADHIVSAKEIHSDDALRLYVSDEKRNDTAVNKKNIAYTNSSLNQSKGEHDMKDWMKRINKKQTETNATRYGVDEDKAKKKDEEARDYINEVKKQEERTYYVKNTSREAGKRALNQGKKQAVGVLIYEVNDMFFAVLTPVLKSWNTYNSMSARIEDIKKRCLQEIQTVQTRIQSLLRKILTSGSTGIFSGAVSTVIEVAVNTFMTTAAAFGKILCDGIQGVIRAFKVLTSNDPSITKKEKLKKALEIIGSAMIASTGVLISETISKNLLTTPLAKFAEPIGNGIGVVFTGFFTASLIYTIENFGAICSQVKDAYKLIQYGIHTTKEEIETEYQTIIGKIDDAYTLILSKIQQEYAKLNKLQELVDDFTLLAEEQFNHSVIYADAMNVPTQTILKNEISIDDYFLN